MDNVNKILQRITAIEQRFIRPITPSVDFPTILANAEKTSGLVQGTPTSSSATENDITRMIQVAANKYGVDPKLALAVAKTESDLSPDVTSSAGAVGVMQLMPDTASALGVRNIKDPRENIDGGVHYLQQMLSAFNGDVTKAVAAYNAGPQAVKNYNGVPPYSETKAYVAKVLSLCK